MTLSIVEFEQIMLDKIDAQTEHASEDELFAGGYLRGHISLSLAACEKEGVDDIEQFKQQISDSIELARSELNPVDREIVLAYWRTLSCSL